MKRSVYADSRPINLGNGADIEIGDLARLIAEAVGLEGKLVFDSSNPDGVLRKLLDSSRLAALGRRAHTDLRDGLTRTYRWFAEHRAP